MPNNLSKIDRRRRSLLILECDTITLDSQNLAMGDFVERIAGTFFPQNPIELIKIDKEQDLLDAFAEAIPAKKKYKNIFIIGHSNKNGIKLALNRFVDWNGLAQWLTPFEPKQITFLACQAANMSSCGKLFEGINSLNEIFGSPINVDTKQAIIALFNSLMGLENGKADSSSLNMAQLTNFVLTKKITFHFTRKTYEKYGEGEMEMWNFIESNLHKIIS